MSEEDRTPEPTGFTGSRNGIQVALKWNYVANTTYNVVRTSDSGWEANGLDCGNVTDPNSPTGSVYQCVAVVGGLDSQPATWPPAGVLAGEDAGEHKGSHNQPTGF